MFKEKKHLISCLIMFLILQVGYSQVSIGELSLDNSQNCQETISTRYGNFTILHDTQVEYYESGAVKSFFFDGTQTIFVEGLGDVTICSPYQANYDPLSASVPLVFYENGNIKSLKLSNKMPNGSFNLKIKFSKYNDEIVSATESSKIDFYENGCLKSFTVTSGQSLSFLQNMVPSTKTKVQFKGISVIELYDDGYLKSFTPSSAVNFPNGLNLALQKKQITLARNSNVLISFYPVNGSSLKLGENISVQLVNNEPVVLSDDGKKLKEISWKYDTGFVLSNVDFYGTKDKPSMNTVYFNDSGAIVRVKGIEVTSNSVLDYGKSRVQQFTAVIEGKLVAVEELILNEDSSINCVVFGVINPFEISSKEVENDMKMKGFEKIKAIRMYYNKEGQRIAATGSFIRDFGSSFYSNIYNSINPCFVLYNKGNISDMNCVEGLISEENEILFDANGKPEAYSYKDNNDTLYIKEF